MGNTVLLLLMVFSAYPLIGGGLHVPAPVSVAIALLSNVLFGVFAIVQRNRFLPPRGSGEAALGEAVRRRKHFDRWSGYALVALLAMNLWMAGYGRVTVAKPVPYVAFGAGSYPVLRWGVSAGRFLLSELYGIGPSALALALVAAGQWPWTVRFYDDRAAIAADSAEVDVRLPPAPRLVPSLVASVFMALAPLLGILVWEMIAVMIWANATGAAVKLGQFFAIIGGCNPAVA